VLASRSERVAKVLINLSELGYDGLITIELDDFGIGYIDFGKKLKF
jgi:EAL domain-containing protein (putative c-di-GMP-specific phosphodiesterase class I)